MPSKILTYKKSNIHFTDDGQGDTVVLLHGFLESISIWNNLKPLLLNYRVICIDLPGHGHSDDLGQIHSMEEMALTVHFVLDYLKVNNVIILGHSMGGYVTLAYAEMYPKKVKGLALINSTPLADSAEKQRIRDRAIEAIQQNYKTFARISISGLFADKNKKRLERDINLLVTEALKMSTKSVIAAIKGMKTRKDRTSIFLEGSFKKLLLLGKDDPFLDQKQLSKITKNHPKTTEIIPGGHMSFLENYTDYSYFIMYFIENL